MTFGKRWTSGDAKNISCCQGLGKRKGQICAVPRIVGAAKLLCVVLEWWICDIIHWPKLTECVTLTMHCSGNHHTS